MMITRTPSQHHDYNIKLTKEELLALSAIGLNAFSIETAHKLFDLIDKEAGRIGDQQGS